MGMDMLRRSISLFLFCLPLQEHSGISTLRPFPLSHGTPPRLCGLATVTPQSRDQSVTRKHSLLPYINPRKRHRTTNFNDTPLPPPFPRTHEGTSMDRWRLLRLQHGPLDAGGPRRVRGESHRGRGGDQGSRGRRPVDSAGAGGSVKRVRQVQGQGAHSPQEGHFQWRRRQAEGRGAFRVVCLCVRVCVVS